MGTTQIGTHHESPTNVSVDPSVMRSWVIVIGDRYRSSKGPYARYGMSFPARRGHLGIRRCRGIRGGLEALHQVVNLRLTKSVQLSRR